MTIKLDENIKALRKQKDITQEILAEAMGVSVQAVSKWECGQSCPDIELLPILASYFGVSIDWLLTMNDATTTLAALPDDDKLRVLQCRGRQVMAREDFDGNANETRMRLLIDKQDSENNAISIEVWGNADIEGDVSNNVNAGKGVNCGNVGNNVEAGHGINCGNVGNNVDAGHGINCGNVGNNVDAGSGVNCGNIANNIDAGGGITCGNISGSINSCAGDVHCRKVEGEIHCAGSVIIKD